MGLKIEVESKKNGVFAVKAAGSIDTETYGEFKKQVQIVIDQKAKSVLLDMSEVDYISSVGLGVIFGLQRRLKEAQGQLVMCNLKPHIQKVFEIVKALPMESIFTSVEEADQYLDKMMKQEIAKQKPKT